MWKGEEGKGRRVLFSFTRERERERERVCVCVCARRVISLFLVLEERFGEGRGVWDWIGLDRDIYDIFYIQAYGWAKR